MSISFQFRLMPGLLLCLAVVVPRLLVISRTVAPARDGMRYFQAALDLDSSRPTEGGPRARLARLEVHPLYPISLLGVRRLGAWVGLVGPHGWVCAAQIWSVACYLAFILLAYRAGARLFGEPIALGGCLVAAILPRQAAYSADVLCDSLHAALWMTAFFLLVRAWQEGRSWQSAAAGLAAGLAYWTHLQGIVLAGIVLVALAVTGAQRLWTNGRWWKTGLGFAGPYAITLGLLVAATGSLSPRGAFHSMTDLPSWRGIVSRMMTRPAIPAVIPAKAGIQAPRLDPGVRRGDGEWPNHSTLLVRTMSCARPAEPASAFIIPPSALQHASVADPGPFRDLGYEKKSLAQSLRVLGIELAKETQGWLLFCLVIGIATCWIRPVVQPHGPETGTSTPYLNGGTVFPGRLLPMDGPGSPSHIREPVPVSGWPLGSPPPYCLLAAAMGLYAVMLVLLPMKCGYVAGRYLMPIVPFLGMIAVRGAFVVADWAACIWRARAQNVGRSVAMAGFAIVSLAISLPGWFWPLHPNRHGHLAAARWVAERLGPGETVFDPSGYVAFFAERPRWIPSRKTTNFRVRFVVLDPALWHRTSAESHELLRVACSSGRLVAQFPRRPRDGQVGVQIVESPSPLLGRWPAGDDPLR